MGPHRATPLAAGLLVLAWVGGCDRGVIELLPTTGNGGGTALADAGAPPVPEPTPEASVPEPGTCADDGDCSAPTPFCDPDTSRCVECVSSFDCPWPSRCDEQAQICVQCSSGRECPRGFFCDEQVGACVMGCDPAGECPDVLPFCDRSRNVCVQCLTDGDCATALTNPGGTCLRGACYQCFSDTECPSDRPLCDLRGRFCTACIDDADCPVGTSCSLFERRCH